jgi:apolipoprotein N-acyltransferase
LKQTGFNRSRVQEFRSAIGEQHPLRVYHELRLLPFGEYVPGASLVVRRIRVARSA